MDLEIKLKSILAFISILFLCSCNKHENKKVDKEINYVVTDTANINGYYLELINNKGKTELKINKNDFKILNSIKIPAPSYFIRDKNKKIKSYRYEDVNVDNTLIIVGDLTDSVEKDKNGLSNHKGICGR